MFVDKEKAIPMLFDTKRLHRLFGIAVKRSNYLKRICSYFRTKEGVVIVIDVYPREKEPYICVTVKKENDDFRIEENYFLQLDGSCTSHVTAWVMSVFGRGLHCLQKHEKHKPEEVLKKKPYDSHNWLHEKLHILANWLMDKDTVRFDPYNPTQILGNEEESESDLLISMNIEAVQSFAEKLSKIELTPGIHIVE